MNKYIGETPLKMGGKTFTLVYDWAAIAQLKSSFAEDIFTKLQDCDFDTLSQIICIGLKKHHKDITKDFILKCSPPIYPTIKTIDLALTWAYFGPDSIPETVEGEDKPEKKTKSRKR